MKKIPKIQKRQKDSRILKNSDNKNIIKFLFWLPRILVILFICFISIFAFDIFEGNYGFFGTIIALFMHLIPSFLLIIVLIYSWKRELVGGVLFIILGILYIVSFNDKALISYIIISGTVFIIGILFIINHLIHKRE